MNEREALKLALEALESKFLFIAGDGEAIDLRAKAITAIREALAQPEQEQKPYGYVSLEDGNKFQFDKPEIGIWKPVYTTPPHRKPLTDEEIWKVVDQCKGGRIDFARAIEAAHGIKE